jgi:serine/threonine protein kinase
MRALNPGLCCVSARNIPSRDWEHPRRHVYFHNNVLINFLRAYYLLLTPSLKQHVFLLGDADLISWLHSVRFAAPHIICTMQLVPADRVSLSAKITAEPAPTEAEIVDWAKQIAVILVHQHRQGAAYRNVNPSNIFVNDGGIIELAGAGKQVEFDTNGRNFYWSNERWNSLHFDARDDVWAVGCVLLELTLRNR